MRVAAGAWRATSRPIYHVRHESTSATSPFRPGQPGNAFKDEVIPRAGETVVAKRTNSAFIATDLESRLRAADHDTLVIVGWLTTLAAIHFVPAVHDKLTRGRIHPASIWIPLLLVAWFVVFNAVVAPSALAFRAGMWLLE